MTTSDAPRRGGRPSSVPALAAHDRIPWFGLAAVLLGTFISTLNGRLSTFGLGDIRGAVSAGFDEGAWITTAQTVAQMFVTPDRRLDGSRFRSTPRPDLVIDRLRGHLAPDSVLHRTCRRCSRCSSPGGIASGFFIPLTLSFILLNVPPKYWSFGIAIYALNLELSLNISASLEGWYVEHHTWRWIFWQNVPLALLMSVCLRLGIATKPITVRPPADFFGLVTGGIGLAFIYAALDQGNRLDWLNSGLVWALFGSGALLLLAFFLHEARTPRPLLNLKVVFGAPMPSQFVLIAFLRLTILSTVYLIPLYLGSVRGYRDLEVGDTLIWIAIPQLVFCPLAALMLRRSDARLVSSIGFIFISIACLMVAYNLTPIWGTQQFLPSQLLQALGQSFALSGVIFFGILHLKPQDALTFGAVLQTARLLGGEMGTAFVTTLARVREQVASNLIGLHVQAGDPQVLQRIQRYGSATTHVIDPTGATQRGALVLGNAVRAAATTQSVMDCFVIIALLTAIALLIIVTRSTAPEGPASARPLFPIGQSRAP